MRAKSSFRIKLWLDCIPARLRCLDFHLDLDHSKTFGDLPIKYLLDLRIKSVESKAWRIETPTRQYDAGEGSLQDLLCSYPELETLSLHVAGPFNIYSTNTGFVEDISLVPRRIPVFSTLKLHDYVLKHSADRVGHLWDWPKLTHLELFGVNIYSFLSSVPANNFATLTTFVSDCSLRDPTADHRVELPNWDDSLNMLKTLLETI